MATIKLPDGTIIETSGTAAPTPEPAAEVQAEAATPAPKPEPTPKPARAMAAAMPIPEEPQPARSGDFANMGGICNTSDPDASNPNVFQFVAPREE